MMGKRRHTYDYPRPAVTVDIVLVSLARPYRVLLIRRGQEPFAGSWAIPGGFVNEHESLELAARREMMEETGVEIRDLVQLHTFGDPGRDPRGHTISVVYLARIDPGEVSPRGADDAAEARWFSLARPPRLAFDHREILAFARKYLEFNHPSAT